MNERIKDLQGKVDKISETEKALQRKLNDYEEYQKSKQSRSGHVRARSCRSGQRSTQPQQIKKESQHSRTNSLASSRRPTSNMYSTDSKKHSRKHSKDDLRASKQTLGPYAEQSYAARRNASVLETYPDNNEISPRLDHLSSNQKHNISVGPARLERDGARIFNMAEYFKSKGASGQIDFTEVNSEFRHPTKKGSQSNARDRKDTEKRLLQANLMSQQNQQGNGKKRRNIQNLLAQTEGA